ncbi:MULTISPECIES: hypothetical protein [unclassified Streptomyces]|uniref:hypothetical protein n=1 Tax=unclassified Streptomyces TaxID=2593676 RepID=UPI0006AE0B93|nr:MULTISPECIES: hypothetical protein [unclassified Streptomyces]KOX21211.1 hypothetical protein ADL06_26045 [Streptomyces sp. NRRL F-6491]KOX38734.1 hypothetical protein ADL08_27155 [Streptomyces sp. NRRL F-6492]
MPDTAATADAAAVLLAAPAGQGLGDTLRIVLLASLVGGVLLAWFLLRGYRTDDTGDTDGVDGASDADGSDRARGASGEGDTGRADGNAERDANA